MKRFFVIPLAALGLGASGCQSPSENPRMAALAQENSATPRAPAVLVRVTPRDIRFYNLPDLVDVGWSISRGSTRAHGVVGFAPATQQLFVLADSVLSAIDVAAGLVRVVDSTVRLATIGPDGVPYVVGQSGSVGAIEQRQLSIWSDSAAAGGVHIWGAILGRLLVETPLAEGRELRLFSETAATTRVTAPAGPMAVSRWGEIVAVATPSSIEIVDTRDGETSSIEVLEGPAHVAFSASGHMIFTTTIPGNLRWFDRFSGVPLGSASLPGSPATMRVGMWGRFLFVRDTATDTVTVFDIHHEAVVARIATRWTPVTPGVAHDGTLVIRQGDTMIALDPDSLTELGRIAGNAGDIWELAGWRAVQPVSQRVEAATPQAPPGAERELYVQVSSSQNPAWAADYRDRLNSAGLNASVMEPEDDEELYRVVLGPFDTRAEAESTGRSLGLPYWIFSPAESRDAQ